MSINSSNPSIKRVLNVNQMRSNQSIKSNFEIKAKPDTDLHRLNSIKSMSMMEKRQQPIDSSKLTSYILRQTSEIDGDESLKNNPLFQEDVSSTVESAVAKLDKEKKVEVLKIDCEFKSTSVQQKPTPPPPPPPPPLPTSLLSSPPQPPSPPPPRTIEAQTDKTNLDSFKRNDSIKSFKRDISSHEVSTAADSFKRDVSVKTLTQRDSLKSFKRESSLKEDALFMRENSFKSVKEDAFSNFIRQDSIKSKSSIRTNHNDNEDNIQIRNIFPHVALSDVGFEPRDEYSDEETETLNQSNFDMFSYTLGALKLVERKNSDIFKECKNLKMEINNECLVFELKSIDILYNLIAVNVYQKYWFAGFKNTSQNLLNKIHFGDEILSINDYLLNDVQKESFELLAKNSTRPLITVKLKRLPYARIILLTEVKKTFKESSDYEMKLVQKAYTDLLGDLFGIKLKAGTAKIEKILDCGLFYRNGLKYDANKVDFDIQMSRMNQGSKVDEKDRLTKWVITEINGDSINYRSSAEEIFTRLSVSDMASVIVQPYDLVKSLHKEKTKSIFRKF